MNVQMPDMRGPSPSDMETLLGVLLAPEEDSPATVQALLMWFHDTGRTLLGHAVAWGYSEALPPLLAAARCSRIDHYPEAAVRAAVGCT